MTLLARFCIFVDGMGRGIIFPIGPALVYHMASTNGAMGFDSSASNSVLWKHVFCDFALVVAIYSVGRLLGELMSRHIQLTNTDHLQLYVSRLGGSVLSLYFFTYVLLASGIWSISWLILMRFLSAALIGFLRQIAGVSPKHLRFGNSLRPLHPSSVEAAKTYVAGVLVSVVWSGLVFYRLANSEHTDDPLPSSRDSSVLMIFAGNSWFTPILMIGVAFAAECSLRVFFSFFGASTEANHFQPDYLPDVSSPSVDSTNRILEPATSPLNQRLRLESAASADDFFDCRSMQSDMDLSMHSMAGQSRLAQSTHGLHNDASSVASPKSTQHFTELCQYTNKKCVYADGSPSYVPRGDSIATVPQNYLDFFRGNTNAAKKAYEASQKWRRDYNVWRIHTLPNTWFPRIKEAYPHFIHGHSKAGYPIAYEQPGKMNLKELFRTGCRIEDMVFHYRFFLEYISNVVCNREDIRNLKGPGALPHNSSSWGIMVVMDVKGAGLSHLSGDVLSYLKQAGDMNSAHYPLSMKRAFVVNSPFWLAGAWSSIKGILPESVQVDIRSEKNYYASLCQYIDEDQIPREYGGKSPYPLGQHPYEVGMADFVKEASEHTEPSDLEQAAQVESEENVRIPELIKTNEVINITDANKESEEQSQTIALSPLPLRRSIREVSLGDDQYDSDVPESAVRSVALLNFLSSAVQGSLEVLLPLWMLSPPLAGGLGFSPLSSCILLLFTFLALLGIIRKIHTEAISRVVIHTPLRAFRLGIGSQMLLLALLASIAGSFTPSQSELSMLCTLGIFVTFVGTAFAVIFGHSSSMVLHNMALNGIDLREGYYGFAKRPTGLEWHGKTSVFCLIGEILGAFIFIPVWSWTMSDSEPEPFRATPAMLGVSSVCLLMYLSSLYLHLMPSKQTRWSDFAHEAIVLGAADMASLFGDSKSKTLTSGELVEGSTIEKIRKAI